MRKLPRTGIAIVPQVALKKLVQVSHQPLNSRLFIFWIIGGSVHPAVIISQNSRTTKKLIILQWSSYFLKLFFSGKWGIIRQLAKREFGARDLWNEWSESSLSSVRAEAFWQDCRQCCSSTAWYFLCGETKGFSPEMPSLVLIREQGSIGFDGKIGQECLAQGREAL